LTDQNSCTAAEQFDVGYPLTVTKTTDYDPIEDGPEIGTLRYAMEYANSNPGPDSIAFDFKGAGPFTIYPERPLPIITQSLIIDGYSQVGSAPADENDRASLMIEINGLYVDDEWGGGFGLDASNNIIRGLMINGFDQMGILIVGSSGNVIEGNHIGIDMVGDQLDANYEGCVVIDNGSNNIIGGDTPAQRNVMAGVEGSTDEDHHLIAIQGNLSENNIIKGNYLGVNAGGQAGLGSTEYGISVLNGAHHNIIGPGNVISGLQYAGIRLNISNPHHNRIIGNYIGTDYTGTTAIANMWGILIEESEDNAIGGPLQDDGTLGPEGNVISGNSHYGILIDGRKSVRNLIQGNIVGLDHTGNVKIGNGCGIKLGEPLNTTIGGLNGGRNIISGNSQGIVIETGSPLSSEVCTHKIIGNYIGTNMSGEDSIGNSNVGIQILFERNIFIGGSLPGEGNLICGSPTGILLGNTSGHQIQGNFIGTDVSGAKHIGNGKGIYLTQASYCVIGGTGIGEGNLISGNETGIYLDGYSSPSRGNTIQGNYIGTDLSGLNSLGNETGVHLEYDTDRTLIGGTGDNEGNLIAFNINGIVCKGGAADGYGNSFLSNTIHSNGNLGINLYDEVDDAVTVNDPQDADDGPNGLQNYPRLDTLTFTQDEVMVAGSLYSLPGQDYLLQFFVSPEADDTGYGEGKTFIGSDTVTCNNSGYTNFHLTYPVSLRDGLLVTATATDTAGNTSEFSNAVGGAQDQQASDFNMPMHWVFHKDGIPYISDSSDFLALHRAFDAWEAIPTSEVDFEFDGTTTQEKAVANDGINLVTFMDESYFTTNEVLGLAAKTLMMDDISGTAEIVDADIVFNPYFVQSGEGFSTDTHSGLYDLQSIATHEIGHTFGMIHSGVLESTMWYAVLENSTDKRSLEEDDIAWASYRYPRNPDFGTTYGFIKGNITYGDDPLLPVVGGALVIARNTSTGYEIHSYSDEYGNYVIPVPAGTYTVAIEPLDGNVHGYYLTQANISYYIDGITLYTDFPNEYYNGTDEGPLNDNPDESVPVIVPVADTVHDIDLVTNKDVIPPYIMAVTPKRDSTGVSVMTQVFMGFSEQVDINTFTDETCFLTWDENDESGEVFGNFVVADNYGRRIGFTPKEYPLNYSREYTLNITSGVTDLKGNGLTVPEEPYNFITEERDNIAPTVTDMLPDHGNDTVFTNADIMVFFSEAMDALTTPDGFSVTYDGGQMVQGVYSWSQDLKILTFNPDSFLDEGTEYTVSVTSGLKDLSQNPLAKDSILIFSTVPEAQPRIIYVGPEPDQDSVSLDSPLLIDFSEPIDPQTVNINTVQLSLNNTPVTGTFEYLFSNSRVIFRPDQLLQPETTYDILVTDQIRDVSDPPLLLELGVSHQFVTADAVEDPYIGSLDPSSGVPGTMVTIAGRGIDPNPQIVKVMFGETEATVIYSESTFLTTRVPLGATEGMVSMEVNGILSNEEYFYVPPFNENPGDEIRRVVGTQAQAEDVEIEPDAAYAYITNSGADAITRLNMVTFQTQSLEVGDMPVQIDIHPNGDIAYVSNHLSHDVSVIDLDLMQVMETIAVGVNPYGLVVSPTGDLLFVAHTTSQDVIYIDVDPYSGGYDKVVRSVKTHASNTGIDVSPDAGLVLIACEQGILFLITDEDDPAFNTINRTVKTSGSATGVEILPDAGLAVAFTENDYLEVIGIVPGVNYGKIVGRVNTRGSIGDIDISPDGEIIYVTHPLTSEVSVYQIEYTGAPNSDASVNVSVNLELINVIEVDDMPYAIAADPRGERVLVGHYTQDGQVTEIDVSGSISSIRFLEELIESVMDAIGDGIINSKYGDKLLVDLGKTLDRTNNAQFESAIDHLDNFIKRVQRWIHYGEIPEDLGNAWLEAAYRIREQLVQDMLAQEDMLKGTGEGGSKDRSIAHAIQEPDLPVEQALKLWNQPNPFSQQTLINFEIPEMDRSSIPVVMRVFNTNGQVVRTLVHMDMEPGRYTVNWSGSLDDGGLVPDGIYLLELKIPGQRETLTLSIIR
jgi:YVTN family beta-propeller protein